MIDYDKTELNKKQLNVRQKNVSDLFLVSITKDLANLTMTYDYYVEGKSRMLNNNISINCVHILEDGRILCETPDQLQIWNPLTNICDCVLESHIPRFTISTTQNGKIFIAKNRKIKLWNHKMNICRDICPDNTFNKDIHFILELSENRIAAAFGNQIKIINMNTGSIEHNLYHYCVCFCELIDTITDKSKKNDHTERIACVGMLYFKIWNTYTGTCDFHLDCQALSVKISLDMKICIGLYNGKIIILRPEKNSFCYDVTLEGHTERVSELLILSNGLLVSGSYDCTLKIWNLENNMQLMTLKDHNKIISCIAELPDGRIISGSHDNTLKIWSIMASNDVKIQSCEMTLNHIKPISSVAILPNGHIVSGAYNYLNISEEKQIYENNYTLTIWS